MISSQQVLTIDITFSHSSRMLLSSLVISIHFITKPKRYQSIQSLSHVWFFATPWTAAHQAFLSITNSRRLLKLMSTELVMPSSHLILCRPLPPIFPSIKVFSNELTLRMRWPQYWSFSFSISTSNKYSGLISFRMDLLDLPQSKGSKVLIIC